MKVLGLITEYNPFHNGHLYHLKASCELVKPDYTVCVMSGNFTQRGEPAIIDKWKRAEVAVQNGINLVLELPFIYGCNNAEYFAKGSVKVLNRLGVVSHLSFGSEDGELSKLQNIAYVISDEKDQFKEALKVNLELGMSFAKARGNAVGQCLGEGYGNQINSPNNILAIEYLKQLKIQKSCITPVTIKREGDGYKEETLDPANPLASATAIRKLLIENKNSGAILEPSLIESFLPENMLDALEDNHYVCLQDFWQLIQYKILTMSADQLNGLFSSTEGLGSRVKNLVDIKSVDNVLSFVELVKSKRYPTTRIQRLLIHILLDLTRENFEQIDRQDEMYGRILGFDGKGAQLLKIIKKGELASMPILTNINKEHLNNIALKNMLFYDSMASDVYNLISECGIYENSDRVKKPFRMFL